VADFQPFAEGQQPSVSETVSKRVMQMTFRHHSAGFASILGEVLVQTPVMFL
jgi:hypothetical protein